MVTSMLQASPLDGESVLACAYQLKVRSQNPKNFEHWLSQRLWVKFAMFLLSSTSVGAAAIIGDCDGTSVDACAIRGRYLGTFISYLMVPNYLKYHK